eukprot:4844698-Heterocapsa_arctica.AAC.1
MPEGSAIHQRTLPNADEGAASLPWMAPSSHAALPSPGNADEPGESAALPALHRWLRQEPVSYTHLTLPTNREV